MINFSRDYNITKLDFRVPFDTDVDAIRKVIKKIDKEIQADEEMGPNLLGPIKSAGVLALDDAGLIMRVKFKTKPGVQFVIQRQVFKRLKELFKEKGLEFATRDVMVRLPDEPTRGEQGQGEAPSAVFQRERAFRCRRGRHCIRHRRRGSQERSCTREDASNEKFITVFMDLARLRGEFRGTGD